MIHIQQRTLSAFKQHLSVGLKRALNLGGRIPNHPKQRLCPVELLAHQILDTERLHGFVIWPCAL